MNDDLRDSERDKYLQMWSHNEYRNFSPAMEEVNRCHSHMKISGAKSLNDYGAGTGRATKWFQDQGYDVRAIDFARNALEVNVPFTEACLWDSYLTLAPRDWGFCVDVLEHIPTEKVYRVLANICATTIMSVYLRISLVHDNFGPAYLGKPLHLTVQSGDWWMKRVYEHFPHAWVLEQTPNIIVILAHHD